MVKNIFEYFSGFKAREPVDGTGDGDRAVRGIEIN